MTTPGKKTVTFRNYCASCKLFHCFLEGNWTVFVFFNSFSISFRELKCDKRLVFFYLGGSEGQNKNDIGLVGKNIGLACILFSLHLNVCEIS